MSFNPSRRISRNAHRRAGHHRLGLPVVVEHQRRVTATGVVHTIDREPLGRHHASHSFCDIAEPRTCVGPR